jgi:hypothetical protein
LKYAQWEAQFQFKPVIFAETRAYEVSCCQHIEVNSFPENIAEWIRAINGYVYQVT